MANLTAPNHFDAFTLYKSNSPFEGESYFTDFLNASLANGSVLSDPWLDKVNELDALIDQSRLVDDMNLSRATLDAYVTPHIKAKVLTYPAYMSTTSDEANVQSFFSTPFKNLTAALLMIKCPIGALALNMETNPAFGGNEQEFLLPRNLKFEIIDVKEVFDKVAMARIMSEFYALDYQSLKIYNLKYIV